ncbi:MAG: hypothetical protein OSJ66_08775 [Clostridia bacterium]|nr:hypothetical protein [Clostridia bacterium]
MQIFRKLKISKTNRQAAEELFKFYRSKINDDALETLTAEDFENLIRIAKGANFGTWTAIEAAFCLGFLAGENTLKEKIKNDFLKGGDSHAE